MTACTATTTILSDVSYFSPLFTATKIVFILDFNTKGPFRTRPTLDLTLHSNDPISSLSSSSLQNRAQGLTV